MIWGYHYFRKHPAVFHRKNVDRRSSSLEAVLSLDDEEFDGEADKSMAFGGLWTGVIEDLLTVNVPPNRG